MAKVKFTKGELKRQRDCLKQFRRYLPTLQLKKQQLQIEILHEEARLQQRIEQGKTQRMAIETWAGLLAEPGINLKPWVIPKEKFLDSKNIAGVEVKVFLWLEFVRPEYDLFLVPFWVDSAIEELQKLLSLREEILVIQRGIEVLRQELRITTQRVNLFEKVKIPEAEEAIRLIKIYLGDQMANAVGRSKIAKRKLEVLALSEAAA
jgi:V/A-type H+-transporting ATPase subunit D